MKTTATQANTFAVDDVSIGTEMLPTEMVKPSVERLLGTPVEACDNYTADVVRQPGFHTLIAAADIAYQLHYPLALTPDAIWLTIAQGFAQHSNNNAEQLRHRFVAHEGKAVIEVRRDDFIRGSAENPWAEVWPVFSDKIKRHIGDEAHALILSDFSTTGPTEKSASEVVLMDSMQSYFSYEFMTRCGIPAVTLDGTVEDWEKIHERVGRLEQYDLKWWTDEVRPITAELVQAANGKPTASFWKNLYKEHDASGGPYLTGWLLRLLPYLKHRDYSSDSPGPWETTQRNHLLEKPAEHRAPWYGMKHNALPSSASQVPFVWKYRGTEFDYQFVAGVLIITQDAVTRTIRPRIGWAVRQTPTGEPLNPAAVEE
jgi:hypothetical protein